MEEWGVSSIFKDVGLLLFKNIRILHPFILAFLLPTALILFLEVIVVAWMLAWLIVHGALRYQFDGFHAFGAFSKVLLLSLGSISTFVYQVSFILKLSKRGNRSFDKLGSIIDARVPYHGSQRAKIYK